MDWMPFFVTFKLALVSTTVLFFISIPIAYYLSSLKSKIKPILETLISMPLVLPPTVLGFYFLVVFSSNGVGAFLDRWFGMSFLFSFEGLVLASVIYSFPFMINPIKSGMENIPKNIVQAALLMGKSNRSILCRILLPNCKPAILTGIILTFAHCIGEFGIILMIGGSIPGETKVASIAIYTMVESLQYNQAHLYAFILVAISFIILLTVYSLNKNSKKLL